MDNLPEDTKIARSKAFEDLTPREKNIICNGCGSKQGMKVPDLVFRNSCDIHDYMYAKGGKERDRRIADEKFLFNMLNDARRNIFYRSMAYLYYTAVRCLGKFEAFYYDSKPSSYSSESKHDVI